MALEFLSCVQTALLSDSYDSYDSYEVIFLERLYLQKGFCLPSCQQDMENI